MAKTTQKPTRLLFKCQPCDEIEERDRTYTRSYDLVAHLVNTHSLYPMSIKHNATYIPAKSDLRPATAEEISKHKDANKHGKKRAPETASTGEASASVTTLEPEGLGGPRREREAHRPKGDSQSTGEKKVKYDHARAKGSHGSKDAGKNPSTDDARKARETADEKDAAEDEADMREYAALQSKMEARRIAREIKNTRDTLTPPRPERGNANDKPASQAEARASGKLTSNDPALTKKITKPRVNRPAQGTVEGGTGASSATDTTHTSKQTGGKSRGKEPFEKKSTRIAIVPPTAQLSEDDSMTEILGPALVAGALNRKIGDARTSELIKGITECRVEILTTRQKAKLPLPDAPNNSAETSSVIEGAGAYDVRLSLSATDQNVRLELPGDVPEVIEKVTPNSGETSKGITNVEPRRVSLTSVAKPRSEGPPREDACPGDKERQMSEGKSNANTDGRPTGGENTANPKSAHAETTTLSEEREERRRELQISETLESEDNTLKTATKPRVLRDIDIAMAMREHLAGTNPELTTATSFIGAVCGRSIAPGILRAGTANFKVPVELGTRAPPITTAERTKPSAFVSKREEMSIRGRERGGGDVESDSDPETTDVVVVDDTEMSQGETTDNESTSSSSSSNSSRSSEHSRASRKRAADESPEQEHRGVGRQPFPGVVSRGKGGCRVHVPALGTARNATSTGASAGNVNSEAESGALLASGRQKGGNQDEPIYRGLDKGAGSIETTGVRAETPVPYVAGGTSASARGATTREKDDVDPNFDAIPGPAAGTTTRTAPFVAVNARFNVPARLMRNNDVCASSDACGVVPMREPAESAIVYDAAIPAATPRTNDDWGRHGYIISEIYKIIATMEPPWGSQCVYEAAARRFPDVDVTALRMTVLAVLMTQRQCVRDLTLAGARRGPRRDENGEVFIELDLVYANRYSDSY